MHCNIIISCTEQELHYLSLTLTGNIIVDHENLMDENLVRGTSKSIKKNKCKNKSFLLPNENEFFFIKLFDFCTKSIHPKYNLHNLEPLKPIG